MVHVVVVIPVGWWTLEVKGAVRPKKSPIGLVWPVGLQGQLRYWQAKFRMALAAAKSLVWKEFDGDCGTRL